MEAFVERLLDYIQGPCGQAGFRKRVGGVPEDTLADFEKRLFGGPIPSEYRGFLLQMGHRSSAFKLIERDMGGFQAVWDWYSEPPEDGAFFPRGDSILIAVGMEEQLYLDGEVSGRRPVAWRGGYTEEETRTVADSLELFCFQRAWHEYLFNPLGMGSIVEIKTVPGALEKAVAAAERAGLKLEAFSDTYSKHLTGTAAAAGMYPKQGRWEVYVRCPNKSRAEELAEAIARASGEMLPRSES